jgi:hypothetical protein
LFLGLAWLTVSKGASLGEKASNKNETERGRYLVGEVTKCIVYPMPRDANGDLKGDA